MLRYGQNRARFIVIGANNKDRIERLVSQRL